MTKQKVYLLLENLDQLKKSKYLFGTYFAFLDWYLFQLIVLLKIDFDCLNSFTLSWVGKVTTES